MSEPVRSLQNERLRWLRRLLGDRRLRLREGMWVVEGLRLAEEVFTFGGPAKLWVMEEGWAEKGEREAAFALGVAGRGDPVMWVRRGVLRELADTRTPQGVLVAFQAPRWEERQLVSGAGPVVFLDGLQEPGNLGTIARIAEGAGAAGLVLGAGTADVGNPKALRASAGALLRLPAIRVDDAVGFLGRVGRRVVATSGTAGTRYDCADLRRPFMLLLGQEGAGLSAALESLAEEKITIPMAGAVESLNVASACAVILYEAVRQRRAAGPA